MDKAEFYIEKLNLIPHPEGGFFKEVYRSGDIINNRGLPDKYDSERTAGTSIYFLLKGSQFSSWHKLKSDEIWHFYDGCSIRIYIIDNNKNLTSVILGNEIEKDELFQFTIKAGNWFAAQPVDPDSFSLIGCTVSPGFEFEDFELGEREKLIAEFPKHRDIIEKLTNQ